MYRLRGRVLSLTFIVLLMVPSLFVAVAGAVPESEPAEYASAAVIDNARARANVARVQLDEMAVQFELASQNYFEAKEQLEVTIAEIVHTEEQLADNEEQLDQVSGLLSERAVATYQNGDLSFVEFLFDSSDFSDLLARLDMVRTIMESDANLIREVRALRADIEGAKVELEAKQILEREIAEEKETEFASAQRVMGEQQRFLASLDAEVLQLVEEERARIQEEQIRQAEAEERQLTQSQPEQNREASATGSTNTSNSNSSNSTSNNNTSGGTGSNNSSGNSSGSSGSGSATRPPASNPPPANTSPNLGRPRPGVVTEARRHVGVVPYVWGGSTPAGFDCSGLTQWSYRVAYGIHLPRTSRQQFHAGVFIPPDRRDLMQPGDLLFYSSTGRPQDIHHVAIFIGNSRMIHAPTFGRMVEEAPAFTRDFIGAVRP